MKSIGMVLDIRKLGLSFGVYTSPASGIEYLVSSRQGCYAIDNPIFTDKVSFQPVLPQKTRPLSRKNAIQQFTGTVKRHVAEWKRQIRGEV